MREILKISGLTGGYVNGIKVLRGIDLSICEGEAVGIIGLNGSGKSTLGKAIINVLPWRDGQVFFDGEDITGYPVFNLANIGIMNMLQGGQVFQNLSVWENLRLAFRGNLEGEHFQRLKSLIPLLDMPSGKLAKIMADKLSGGQRHQLALAMTLASKPKLIILDEPSAGLSPKAVNDMYSLLKEVREKCNVTIVLIEQNINKAICFCDRCIIVSQGQIGDVVDASDSERARDIIMNKLGI